MDVVRDQPTGESHMNTRNKRIAGIAAVGLLVGGGIGGAFAATSGQDDPAGDLASALSERTGEQVSAADVKGAFTDVLKQRLQEDVQSGRITQAQADDMLKRAASAPLPGMDGPGHHRGHRGGGMHEIRDAVAKKLGMTEQQLHDAREQGKTLAQVAQSKGVDKAELITTLSAAIRKSERGSNLTDAQAKQMATDIVDGTGPMGGRHGGRHHDGHDDHMPPPGP